MDDWTQLLKDPANYLFGLGVAAILGVWWARMTPAQSNATLVLGVLAIGGAVAIKTAGQPIVLRALWVGAVTCSLGLFVNYQLWARTGPSPTTATTPVPRQTAEPPLSEEAVQSKSAAPEPPSLFSLFMNDLIPGVGLKWQAYSDFELPTNGVKARIFYNVYNDFISNVYFASFYVPEVVVSGNPDAELTTKMGNHIALNYAQFIEDIRSKYFVEHQGSGDSVVESTRHAVFSGRVYIYHAGSLSLEQQAMLQRTFNEHGAQVQFRGMDYVLAAWSSIRLGDMKPPPQYEVRDNLPHLVGEAK
jgi:hypothetical protein